MKVSNTVICSALITFSLCLLIVKSEQTFAKFVADKFQDSDNTLGVFARLYHQFEELNTLNDQEQYEEQDDLPQQIKYVLANESVSPDVDPISNNQTNTTNSTSNITNNTYPVDHPDDPIFTRKRQHSISYISTGTPVWGILTEPLRGTINVDDNNTFSEYIPAPHVKFLQQTGAKIIPISYKLTREDLYAMLDKVSGLYIHGDSVNSVNDELFQATFSYILTYFFSKSHDDHDYFPIFMMGNSLQSLVINRVNNGQSLFKKMGSSYYNKNLQLRTIIDPTDSYIFDELNSTQLDLFVHKGKFFNRQLVGLRYSDFKKESKINQRYQVVATFNAEDSRSQNNEYIAIMENKDMPLYLITYNVEFTQFVFSDVTTNSDQSIVDHTTYSRKHVQYLAQQIGDEGRHCKHKFDSYDDLYPKLIRHSTLANVEYSSNSGDSSMPKGLETQEVYFIKSPY